MTAGYERQRRYERRKSAAAADIGELPPVKNPKRREACRLDLHRYLVEYFPQSTGLKPFGADQLRAIDRIQHCAIYGGLFVQAFPRGGCKTTISENSALWAASYGHRGFIPVLGATAAAAANNIRAIKMELSDNDQLYDDFPEICHAIRALEGKSQRCASQTYSVPCAACAGVPADNDTDDAEVCKTCGGAGSIPSLTHIKWTGDTIVLPTIRVPQGWGTVAGPGKRAKLVSAPSSGAILTARGLTGASRGMVRKRKDGTQKRPDFLLIDDPQTAKSASTDLQVNKNLSIVTKDVLGLSGHACKLAAVMNVTVIRRNDMADRLLDRKQFPAWQGERIKMMRKWADAHETLWLSDYAALRNDYDPNVVGDQERAHKKATAFYKKNRGRMDAGCEVFWEHCFDSSEISAIQHGYNLLIDRGSEVFASEYQNEPLADQIEGQAELMPAKAIAAKVNRLPRQIAPATATRLVGFIDPKETILYWMVAAFEEGFGGYIVDYGTWPDQHKNYFAAREARFTLASETRQKSLEARVVAGLDALIEQLAGREWKRQDGSILRLSKCLIDRGYGKITELVDRFCRVSKHAAVLMPSQGKYYGATSTPMKEYKRKPGERVGLNWRVPPRGAVRHVYYDTNFYKGFVHERLAVPLGVAGSLSIWGDEELVKAQGGRRHELLADHLVAETPVTVTAKGRSVIEFREKPGRPDNDWLDCVVGCHVAASMLGVQLDQMRETKAIARQVRFSEIQRARRLGQTTTTPTVSQASVVRPVADAGEQPKSETPAAQSPSAGPPAPASADTGPASQRKKVRFSEVQRKRRQERHGR